MLLPLMLNLSTPMGGTATAAVTFIPRIMVYCFGVFLTGVILSQLQLLPY